MRNGDGLSLSRLFGSSSIDNSLPLLLPAVRRRKSGEMSEFTRGWIAASGDGMYAGGVLSFLRSVYKKCTFIQ